MPARLSYCAVQQQISASPPFEGVAMTIEGKPSLGPMIWMTGRSGRPAKARLGNIATKLALLLSALSQRRVQSCSSYSAGWRLKSAAF